MAIQMSPEVEAALGREMAAQARQVTEGSCITCGGPLDSGPTSVIAARGTNLDVGAVWFTHGRCAESEVWELPDEAAYALVAPEGGTDMMMKPAVNHANGDPLLLAELATQVFTDSGTKGSELRSIFMQSVLESGFELITTELDGPRLDQWIAVLTPHGRELALVILAPDGGKIFHGTIEPPPGWTQAALARRQVLLAAGDIGLSRNDDEHADNIALSRAARAGKLAGARIAIGRPADFGLS
jgi:hypothetical protein